MLSEDYLEAFLEEAEEQFQALEQGLVRLEKNPGDRGCLEEVFRLAHTLKGNAATVGLEDMARLAHRMEDLLDALRRGAASVTPEVTDVLLACLDVLKGLAEEAAGGGGRAADLASLTSRLEGLMRTAGSAEEKRDAAAAQTILVKVELADDCAMRAARAYVVLRCLQKLGTVVESRPAVPEVEDGSFDGLEIEAVVAAAGGPEAVERALAAVPEVERAEARPLPEGRAEARVEAGAALDPAALSARLAEEGAARIILDLSGLRELDPAGLDWLLSLRESRPVEVVPPALPAGRQLFELLGLAR